MANFNFTVDTEPMAKEISKVSKHVHLVSGSVIAMQAAVVKAEKEAADVVCQNVNQGFYSLMQSQLSQKIAALTSEVEAKLMDMGQQAAALNNIRSRMEHDYNMIAQRYTKLFGSLNKALYTRIYELDKPAVTLINRDIKLVDGRLMRQLGNVYAHQKESVVDSQLILSSKIKGDGLKAIEAIRNYVSEVNLQAKQSEAVISNVEVEGGIEKLYIPVLVTESSTESGAMVTKFYTPKSSLSTIDLAMESSASQDAVRATTSGEWENIPQSERRALDSEFLAIVNDATLDERTKGELMRLYGASSNIKHLIPSKR